MSANRKSKYSTQLSYSLLSLSFIFRILDTLSDAKSLWRLPSDKFTDLFVSNLEIVAKRLGLCLCSYPLYMVPQSPGIEFMHETDENGDCTSQVRDGTEVNVRTCRRNGER
jgi:hypothetical protein